MAYRQQLYISPTTLTDLTVTIEYDNQELPSRTLTLNDFSIVNDELKKSFALLDDCTITIQSQGYETKILNITTEHYEDKHIVLTPLLDYFSKVSDGTDTYFVKAEVIKNQQNNSSLKYWTGTKAQYDAIVTKDSNTLYWLTDAKITYLGNNAIGNFKGGRNVGEIIQSSLPLTDAGLHLLDGTRLSGDGIYGEFVQYIADLYTENPTANYFTDETSWQTSVTTYGSCGKFVYDSTLNTVRLPKVSDILQGTTDLNALGDLVEAGLPNITGEFFYSGGGSMTYVNGVFSQKEGQTSGQSHASGNKDNTKNINFNASRSSSIYGNSTTVQPQTIKGFIYIVIATSTKTDIQVDIDEIATDLNGKADRDGSNMVASIKNFDGQWVNSSLTLASGVTALKTSSTSYDLSSYLPNDNYNYEVLFTMNGQTKAAASSYSYGILSTDIITSNCYVFIARTAMNTTNAIQGGGSIILPVGTGRTVTVGYNSNNSGNYSLNAVGYRRIGTNS